MTIIGYVRNVIFDENEISPAAWSSLQVLLVLLILCVRARPFFVHLPRLPAGGQQSLHNGRAAQRDVAWRFRRRNMLLSRKKGLVKRHASLLCRPRRRANLPILKVESPQVSMSSSCNSLIHDLEFIYRGTADHPQSPSSAAPPVNCKSCLRSLSESVLRGRPRASARLRREA